VKGRIEVYFETLNSCSQVPGSEGLKVAARVRHELSLRTCVCLRGIEEAGRHGLEVVCETSVTLWPDYSR